MLDTRSLLSQSKFYESYSRFNEDKQRPETWDEAIDRVMSMHRTVYADKLTPELEDLINAATLGYKQKLQLGAQRALQFGGDQLLKHHLRNYNCAASYVDRADFFGEYFYVLLCGAGAGFSVQKHHVAKLPKITQRTKQPKIYVVEDSIEGWAGAADVLLSSFFEDGGKHPEYKGHRVYFDLSQIRPKGSKISGGFVAPGPEPLRRSLDRIEYLLQGLVLREKKFTLRPIHCYDIAMHIADAVISGGVRRAATIALFSVDDDEMINAKTGNWFQENPQRARSNNSAVILRNSIEKEKFMEIMKSVEQFGEPGYFFVDDLEALTNPCCEIGLYAYFEDENGVKHSGWQFCNLTEINGAKCTTKEEFWRACSAAAILGTLQAGYTDFKFLSPWTKKICDREALLGCSITGWMNNPQVLFDAKTLSKGVKIIKDMNEYIAGLIGINPSARLTTVKPSGNASVLLGCASSINGEHAPYYFRNVQMNKESEIARIIQELNPYMVEESVWSAGKEDYVISFPVTAPKSSIFRDDLFGVKLLDKVKFIYENWVLPGTITERCVNKTITHNVSNTISVDNWEEVSNYVFENKDKFGGISFLSIMGDKIYNQAPFTSVMNADDIVEKYGAGAMFASGLIVEGLKLFDNLWNACAANEFGYANVEKDEHLSNLRAEWLRRFKAFSLNYFDGDAKQAEYALKDVYLLHKWQKISQNFVEIEWEKHLTKLADIDIDTMGAIACAAGDCEIKW